MRPRRTSIALALACVLIGACTNAVPASPSPTPLPPGAIPLNAVAPSKARGSMTVSPGATGTLLTLELSGLRPGTLYAAWLHSGTCAQPSASAGHLVTESATARGDWGATAKSVHTAAGTLVALTPDLLGSGDQLVAVRDPTGTVIACGEIPKGAR